MSDQYPRGSEWRRWDPHVHTKGTAKNDNFTSLTFNDFCVTLFHEALSSEISAIAITDYFSIDNYKKVLKFVEELENCRNISGESEFSNDEIKKIRNIFILPNVELRMLPSTDSGRLINIHCLFNPSFSESAIDNDFFNSLEYSSGNRKFKMNRNGIMDLGKFLDNRLDGDAAYKKGVNSFVVSCSQLQKLHDTNKEFRNNVLIVVSNSNTDGASAIQKHYDLFENDPESQLDAERKSIYVISNMIFSSNPNDRVYFLGDKGVDDVSAVKEKCGSLKPCIHGSDAHTEEKLFKPIDNRFCWIKSDLTFEGLKQIVWEPKERVIIQERNPNDSKPNRLIIDYVVYKNSGEIEKKVYFNRDLNSIIGVRGSGKSTLLKNIAKKIDIAQFNEKDKKQPYTLNNFNVKWVDGEDNNGSDESPKSIFYIPQGYLSSIAYEDGEYVSKRDQFITDLLKKNSRFAHAMQVLDDFISKNKIKIDGFIEELLLQHKSLKESVEILKKHGSKCEIEKEISEKKEKIKQYGDIAQSGITDNEIEEYTNARQIVVINSKILGTLNQDVEILGRLSGVGADILISSQDFNLLSEDVQSFIRSEVLKKGREDIINLIKFELNKIQKEILEINTKIRLNQSIILTNEEKIKKVEALDSLTNELSDLQKTLEKINETSQNIELQKREIDISLKNIIQSYDNYKVQQDLVYSTIEFDKEFSFLKIDVTTSYNLQQIKDYIEKNINTRDSGTIIRQESDIEKLISEDPTEPTSETLQKIIVNLINGNIKIKTGAGDISMVISQLFKNRREIDYLNSVKTKDGEVIFKDMTGGQKAIALLELIFSFNDEKYPILIDQPEDDLDVGGVAADLVNFIKSEKIDRQIFVVSHSASLVVCSDSEDIIVSTNNKVGTGQYDFLYSTGSIENQETREDIIKILEGGEDALITRARKLNFKNII